VNATIPNQVVETACSWVFYDDKCPLCLATVARFSPLLRRHQFDLASLQTPWVQRRLGLNPGEPLTEMKLLTADDKIYGGADAALQIAKNFWWAWPLFVLAKIPGLMPLFHATYRRIVANRTCFGGQCLIPKNQYHKQN
jgi:predicted DCC family thiol-disulfide oxidoreductase YuxK